MKKEQKQALGARLRAARARAGLPQAFVAEALGVTRQSLSAWENGVSAPSALQLGELAMAYSECAHALLFGVPYEPVEWARYAQASEAR